MPEEQPEVSPHALPSEERAVERRVPAITNSNWKILTVAAIFIAIGAGSFLFLKDSTLFSTKNKVPAAPKEEESFSLAYLVSRMVDPTSTSSFPEYDSQLLQYDPLTATKNTVTPIGGLSVAVISNDSRPLKGGVYYYGKYRHGETSLNQFKNGQEVSLDQQFRADGGAVFFSEDATKGLWCSKGGLKLFDLATRIEIPFKKNTSCGLGVYLSGLSRDGTTVYYSKGFYELYGDYTKEQLEVMSRKAQIGSHALSVTSGEDQWIATSSILVWNNSAINEKQSIVITPAVFERTWPFIIEVKKIQTPFEFLAKEQFESLPTITTLQIPGRSFEQYELTADGAGIFYHLTPADGHNDVRNEFGYFDIKTSTNYFPIPSIPTSDQLRIAAALSKDALYYTDTRSVPSGSAPTMTLYRTDSDGHNEVIDSAIGYIFPAGIVMHSNSI